MTLLVPCAWLILTANRHNIRDYFVRFFEVGVAFAILFVPYLLFNLQLSNELWPTTFFAKQREYAILKEQSIILRLLSQYSRPLVGTGILLLPGIFLSTLKAIRERVWESLYPIIWVVAYLTLYAIRLPVTYQHGRYAMPTIPVLLILGLGGLLDWIELRSVQPLKRIVSRIWMASILVVSIGFVILGANAYATDVAIIETEMVSVARWIEAHTEPEALIAAHDIGAIGYFSDRQLIDLAGLVSPEVVPFLRDEGRLGEYLTEQEADYLVTFPGWYPSLSEHGRLVFETGGEFSPLAGGENMAVYRWP
jgi:hypothetical protein